MYWSQVHKTPPEVHVQVGILNLYVLVQVSNWIIYNVFICAAYNDSKSINVKEINTGNIKKLFYLN